MRETPSGVFMKLDDLPFPESKGSTTYRLSEGTDVNEHYIPSGTTLILATRADGSREITFDRWAYEPLKTWTAEQLVTDTTKAVEPEQHPTWTDPEPTKFDLIRSLLKTRLSGFLCDYSPELVDELPDEALMGLPEATAVWIIEAYYNLQNAGASLAETFSKIERHRNRFIPGGELPVSAMVKSGTPPRALGVYIDYRVQLEHGDVPGGFFGGIAVLRTMKFLKTGILEHR
jgi:hypothetical protein